MTIIIRSDADLPESINTPEKQEANAKRLLQRRWGYISEQCRRPNPQGSSSRTVIVKVNSVEYVVQFRLELLDLGPFKIARQKLGQDAVPWIVVIDDADLARDNIWVYCMSCIPGKTWFEGAMGNLSATRVITVRSLGRLLAKGFMADNSELVVKTVIRHHFTKLLESKDTQIRRFEGTIKDMIGKLNQLEKLPLFIAHFDLNKLHIMITASYPRHYIRCEVSGLVDWKHSRPLPFGMGFCRIHTLAGEFSEGKFHMPPNFTRAEKDFWDSVWQGIPVNLRERIDLKVVQTAVRIGTLLDTFPVVNRKLTGHYNPVAVEALPKFLTYEIPMLRQAGEPPYAG